MLIPWLAAVGLNYSINSPAAPHPDQTAPLDAGRLGRPG
jgi:hypothetical protein